MFYNWTASFRFIPLGQTGAAIHPHKIGIRASTKELARKYFRDHYPSAHLTRIVSSTKPR